MGKKPFRDTQERARNPIFCMIRFYPHSTACCPFWEGSHESWVSPFCDVEHCHSVITSQCAHHPTRGGPCSKPITGRLTIYSRGMQKKSRPGRHLASTGNLSPRSPQRVTFTNGICPECEKRAMAKFKREQLGNDAFLSSLEKGCNRDNKNGLHARLPGENPNSLP